MIEQTQHRVVIPNLPPALQGLRIAQLSDLHRSTLTSDQHLRHAIAQTNTARPDLILLTGDYVTADLADIEPCGRILEPLHAPLGKYAVLGNHDFKASAVEVTRMLTRHGIHVLDNRSMRLENGLCLVGLEDDRYGRPDLERAFHGVREDETPLVLCHNPAGVELVADRNCIVFSGHTHGGQIHVPILTMRQIRRIGSKHYRAGWYTVGRARVYVNRGIGQVGLPVRFLCHSEISLFTLAVE